MGEFKTAIDIKGEKYGRLTVIRRIGTNKNGYAVWQCKCDCGNIVEVTSHSLRSGNTKSCGCYNIESSTKRIVLLNTKHGKSNTRIFRIWNLMKSRCYNKNSINYSDYGGRGIIVCDEWLHDFQAFYDWSIANGYVETKSRTDYTIDRIDVNGNYCPDNCRWVNIKVQQNNKRTNKIIEFNGEKHTISEWSDIIGIDYDVLQHRLSSKTYTVERALTEKKNERGKYKRKKLKDD